MKEMNENGKIKKSSGLKAPKIFLSGSIRGGRQLLSVYCFMYDTLEEGGAEVISWHVVDPELEKLESEMTEEAIYSRDMSLLSESEALVAELTVPSTGVGYEICCALARKIPVLCLYEPEATVSAMLLGNPARHLKVKSYADKEELSKCLLEFLKSIKDE
jgi:nucleoside 2-deoxyribosyltransferase